MRWPLILHMQVPDIKILEDSSESFTDVGNFHFAFGGSSLHMEVRSYIVQLTLHWSFDVMTW